MKSIANILALTILISCGQAQNSEQTTSNVNKIVVEEVLQTSAYTYLYGQYNSEKAWVATIKMEASVGDTYYFDDGLEMVDFKSDELDRTFASVIFLEEVKSDPEMLRSNIKKTASPHSENLPAPGKTKKVEQTEGGISIAELFANKKDYADKVVKIKGEVVKVSRKIMGVNWIHIQDGTDHEGDNDLTITSDMDTQVGTIITVEGKITLDKDFGAGYFYKVILEEGKIVE